MSRFFRGNYGSQLGDTRTAANLIAQAGATQGQALANMGGQLGGVIGGAIEKYQLNKEKQKKNEGFIKSQSGMLDMLAEQDPEMASQYSAMKDQLNNPDVPLATRAEFGKNLVNNITLSTQLKGQRLLQDTQAQTLKEQKNTELIREDLLKQKQKYNNLGIELQELAVTKGKKLSAAEIKDTLDKYGFAAQQREADATLIQPRTDANRSALRASEMESDIRVADAMNRGGPEGVAKEMERDRELKRRGAEADIRSKDSLSNYRIKSIELLEGKSNLPQGSGNEEIETSIKGIDTEIDRIMKGQTFSKDSDGNTLSYSDLIEDINPITGEVTLSEDASNYASKDIARLKELIQSKMQLRLSQKYKVVNRNGELIEVSLADIEEQKAKEMMRNAEIQNAVRSSPPAFPMPDYH